MSGPIAAIPARCFQGVVPAAIATADAAGVPNITYLSQVFRIDDEHVALSCQFFNKTKANVLANPYATVDLFDPISLETYRLELRYDHAETSGSLFDTMALRIDAIASLTGMRGIFRLISADVYEVISATYRTGLLDLSLVLPETPVEPRSISEVRGLQLMAQRTGRAKCLEDLMSTVLATLHEAFGFEHAMMLMLDETQTKLYTIAARGYESEGIGAEIAVGEGLVGSVAREKRVLRMSGVEAELRYGRAIRAAVQRTPSRRDVLPEIPLSGLADAQSHMAMPLVVGERLLGVLAVESRSPLAFDEWHEAYLGDRRQPGGDHDRQHAPARERRRSRRSGAADRRRSRKRHDVVAPGQAFSLFQERRLHLRRRRVSDSQRAGAHPVARVARAPNERPHRIHQPRAQARPLARPAAGARQPREPPRSFAQAPFGQVPRRAPRTHHSAGVFTSKSNAPSTSKSAIGSA